MRLALMWTGGFMDAARHWNGRGQGYQPPSGTDVVSLPPGEGFAMLASPDAQWPEPTPRAAHAKFKGYRFWDSAGSPEFLYQVNGSVNVVHRSTGATTDDGKLSLQRTVSLTGKPSDGTQLNFRVASGEVAIEKNTTYLTANGQRITITGAMPALHGSNLVIPIDLSTGAATFNIEYAWLSNSSDTSNSNDGKTETNPQ